MLLVTNVIKAEDGSKLPVCGNKEGCGGIWCKDPKDQAKENVSRGLVTYRRIVRRLLFAGVDYQGLFVWRDYALVKAKLMFF